jgi:hypothetical protein
VGFDLGENEIGYTAWAPGESQGRLSTLACYVQGTESLYDRRSAWYEQT